MEGVKQMVQQIFAKCKNLTIPKQACVCACARARASVRACVCVCV